MKRLLSVLLLAVLVSTSLQTFAMTETTQSATAPTSSNLAQDKTDAIWIDPEYPVGNVSYDLEAIKLKDYVTSSKPSIMKVKCDGKEILKELGITNAKIVSVGVQEGDFTYNYDFNNCSFWAGKTKYVQATDAITDADALKMAKDFIAQSSSLNFFKKYIGEPIISYRNNYDFAGVMREGKSYSTTVIFPIKIGGKTVYQTYGEPLGLSLEINNKGVNSMNAQILPFGFIKADSYKLDADGLISFLLKGGNNPYYSYNMTAEYKATVKALSYENIYVFTQKYPMYGGAPSLYLTSGIRIKTDKQIDNGPGQEKKDYSMIVSDYKIGNQQQFSAY